MIPPYLDKTSILPLLPMQDCISVMERMFRSLAAGDCLQPLRNLLWLPDKNGILGMMPGYAGTQEILGIKVITIFHANHAQGLPSHQGTVMLFDAKQGTPILPQLSHPSDHWRPSALGAVRLPPSELRP